MLNNTSYKAFFLIPPEVQLLDFAGPAHLFYEANEYGASITTHYLSLSQTKEEVSCTGVSLGNLDSYMVHELGTHDLLFIPGLESHLFLAEGYADEIAEFLEWLQRQHQNGARICSVCTGAYLVAFSGLLDHRNCTTHWKYLKDFKNRFPFTKLLSDRLIVRDGTLYSSAGVSSGIDLALFILEELF